MTNANLFVELSQEQESVVSGGKINISRLKKNKIGELIGRDKITDNSKNIGDIVNATGDIKVKNGSNSGSTGAATIGDITIS